VHVHFQKPSFLYTSACKLPETFISACQCMYTSRNLHFCIPVHVHFQKPSFLYTSACTLSETFISIYQCMYTETFISVYQCMYTFRNLHFCIPVHVHFHSVYQCMYTFRNLHFCIAVHVHFQKPSFLYISACTLTETFIYPMHRRPAY